MITPTVLAELFASYVNPFIGMARDSYFPEEFCVYYQQQLPMVPNTIVVILVWRVISELSLTETRGFAKNVFTILWKSTRTHSKQDLASIQSSVLII